MITMARDYANDEAEAERSSLSLQSVRADRSAACEKPLSLTNSEAGSNYQTKVGQWGF